MFTIMFIIIKLNSEIATTTIPFNSDNELQSISGANLRQRSPGLKQQIYLTAVQRFFYWKHNTFLKKYFPSVLPQYSIRYEFLTIRIFH